jgi:hypothetical protein
VVRFLEPTYAFHTQRREEPTSTLESNISTGLKEPRVSSQLCRLAIIEANLAEPVRLVELGELGWVNRKCYAHILNLGPDGRRSVMKTSRFAKGVLSPTDLAGTETFLRSLFVTRPMPLRRERKVLGGSEQETRSSQIVLPQFRRLPHLPDKLLVRSSDLLLSRTVSH